MVSVLASDAFESSTDIAKIHLVPCIVLFRLLRVKFLEGFSLVGNVYFFLLHPIATIVRTASRTSSFVFNPIFQFVSLTLVFH